MTDTRLPTRSLGRSGLTVSMQGLGCMGMSQSYGPADEKESIATIHRALDLGVFFLDPSRPRYEETRRIPPRTANERLALIDAELDRYAV